MITHKFRTQGAAAVLAAFILPSLRASEADIKIPDLTQVRFEGSTVHANLILQPSIQRELAKLTELPQFAG